MCRFTLFDFNVRAIEERGLKIDFQLDHFKELCTLGSRRFRFLLRFCRFANRARCHCAIFGGMETRQCGNAVSIWTLFGKALGPQNLRIC